MSEINILWSNTDNDKVIEWVKEMALRLTYDKRSGEFDHIDCACVEKRLAALEQLEEETGIIKKPSFSLLEAHITEINGQDVEEIFEGILAITVMKCPECQVYTIDIEE